MKYEYIGEKNRIQFNERPDKEILHKLPKLKFMNKVGIKPDYEDKNIEKPKSKVKVTDFSSSPPRDNPKLEKERENSLDYITADKLLLDKININPGQKSRKVPYFSKQISRKKLENIK